MFSQVKFGWKSHFTVTFILLLLVTFEYFYVRTFSKHETTVMNVEMIKKRIFDDMLGAFVIESVECIEGISCHIEISSKEYSMGQLMRELNNIIRKGYTISAVEISASEIMDEVKLVKLIFYKKIEG